MAFKKREVLLVAFNLLYLLIFTIYYLTIKNYEFLVYILVVFIIAVVLALSLRKSKLDGVALWGLSIWGLLHMLGGGLRINGESLYSMHVIDIINKGGEFYVLKMDQVVHFYGFAVAAIVIFQLIYPRLKPNASRGLIIFLAWIGAMGLGALNEVVEFFASVILAKTGVGGYYNTGLDLVFNLFGALAGAFFASYYTKRTIK